MWKCNKCQKPVFFGKCAEICQELHLWITICYEIYIIHLDLIFQPNDNNHLGSTGIQNAWDVVNVVSVWALVNMQSIKA